MKEAARHIGFSSETDLPLDEALIQKVGKELFEQLAVEFARVEIVAPFGVLLKK